MTPTPPTPSRSSLPTVDVKPSALALRREAAALAIGVSEETFDRYVRPTLPVVRLGSVRVYPVAALEDWLTEHADSPSDELERVA